MFVEELKLPQASDVADEKDKLALEVINPSKKSKSKSPTKEDRYGP